MSLLFRSLGVFVVLGLAALAVAGGMLPRPAISAPQASQVKPPAAMPLSPTDTAAAAVIIDRSPFSQSRSAFSRNAPPEIPQQPIEVKLAGIFKVGKEARASLVIAGQSLVVKKGDETPIGKVTKIEASAVVIEGSPPRRVELFKQ